ncbi:hypothetical protein CANARDRAFT_6249 [[Candida] arabinofermentans NRRL YB-2248]|uniref:ABC transporter domain-containing protein n=1 Tax=[Candida] arabinofermentans NRRL YB-2248 TaxID=983967 RepID=A0A1E4T4H7_9ASCO|nr:hypothetical protein CANARDRAFT_6249 [[Candida] arabinofermentans NRRL YB-2248]
MSSNSISVKSETDGQLDIYEGFDNNVDSNVRGLARELTRELSKDISTSDQLDQYGNQLEEKPSDVLIRTLTSMSQVPGVEPSTHAEVDKRLDPNSDNFDSKFWIKNMRKLMQSNPDHYRPTNLGVVYKNLCAKGVASDSDFQPTVLNLPYKLIRDYYYLWFKKNDNSRYFEILKPLDGLIKPGTLTVVLGRPGAGCSTLLKTISAHTHGFEVDPNSFISYDGLSMKDIQKHYRGEVTYSAEVDTHFPHLTVGQTLTFAAGLRTPQNRSPGLTREEYADHMTRVYMATYGLSHTYNTKVGNDFVRGVSGGERKRVSIAEVSLCGSNVQCWDNATRGLDAATALEFIRALKTSAVLLETTPLIAIYQCSQDAYDLFDNVVVLYEGYQIYFGSSTTAKAYFENMGYECPPRQTTADFLTSITSPAERVTRVGFENKVPKTPKEFSDYWRSSPEFQELNTEIDSYISSTEQNNSAQHYLEAHIAKQSNHTRPKSPYTLSYWMQIKAVCQRNVWRIKADPSITLFSVIANTIMGLILSSLFYNLPNSTDSFYRRSGSMFLAVLFNAFSSMLEVMALFESREIVEKHKKYALYHPSADAYASILTELPAKILTCIAFNLVFYFMVNFRRDPGRFFFYLLINFMATLVMSHFFRSVGSLFRTLSESMTPTAVLLLALVIYTGFVLPTPSMHGWSRWINYLDPIAYVFEALIANEFSGREFECSTFVPNYSDAIGSTRVCSVVSSIAGDNTVSGSAYIAASYNYYEKNNWRNFGIIVAFAVALLVAYVSVVETSKGALQKGEIIVFQQSTLRKLKKENEKIKSNAIDSENSLSGEKPVGVLESSSLSSNADNGVSQLVAGTDVFHWKDVCYEVQIKTETRRILDHVDGWVKPGTLTALMGASGAGKTTLLDVLANRVTMGVVTGDMFVNGKLRDQSFQRSTGYVQQQDIHLQTSTVREALRFSAYLRQGSHISKAEKDAYVENVIHILEMSKYADAIVGVAGEGLNVEQRKRLTIGVELAAKPQLLLFLDEPTSGLDSQTAWSICQLMRKLADNGQAVLCTIHQPSAILLQEFDRLLFLARGGRTVYFGDLGENCETLIEYFEANGAHPCPPHANPAEWMLEVIGAAPGSHARYDYHEIWMNSPERKAVRDELAKMEAELGKLPVSQGMSSTQEFATGLFAQYLIVTRRVFQQYYRTPTYIWSKFLLVIFSTLFNGFSFFNSGTSLQGLQNQMLSTFMITVAILTLVQQMLPNYISQRQIYEVRERPSKTFSWFAFIAAQISAEIPWNILVGTVGFFCWYYPIGAYHNAAKTHETAARGVLSWLSFVNILVYSSTLGQVCIAGIEIADNAANLSSLMFTMSMNFSGVMVLPTGFWIFMYRCSPFTYWISTMVSAAVGNSEVQCSEKELVVFDPPSGQTCGAYMSDYINSNGGYLANESALSNCKFCTIKDTNTFLKSSHIVYEDRWRNYGIFICFIVINIFFTLFFYWLARVPKKNDRVKDEKDLKSVEQKTTMVDEKPTEVNV